MEIAPGGFVRLIDHMGSDLTPVNAARISMGKRHDVFDPDTDTPLIAYLAEHQHTTPFRHPQAMFHIRLPIFVMRQLAKHQAGVVVSEISGRYVTFQEPDIWSPVEWRETAPNVKQGSGGPHPLQRELREIYDSAVAASFDAYDKLLQMGACREQARSVLPLGLYTEVYWTASLQAIAHFIALRRDAHAQKEIRDYADAIERIALGLWPVSLPALLKAHP